MIDPRVASGLRDLPPSVMIPRERMLARFRETFASFGYLPIETPHIERMEVLTGKGAGSDEVLRQIFDVTNKGGTPGELALRFDLTVPLARFVARHVNDLGVPFKRYAIGSVFRGERPAKGRFREFMQCDFDTVGTESPVADAETAAVIHEALSAAGVPDFTITLNNRKILDGLLDTLGLADRTGAVLRSLDKLAKVGRQKVFEELTGQRPAFETSLQQIKTGEVVAESHVVPADQANRILDFAEQGRGGLDVLHRIDETVRSHAGAAEGIANLRQVHRLLSEAHGIPTGRVRFDLGLARGSTTTRASSSRRPSTAGSRSEASRQAAGTTTWRASSPSSDCRASGRRSASTACSRSWKRRDVSRGPRRLRRSWWRTSPASIPRSRCGWRHGFGPRASGPRSSPTRSRSATRWATGQIEATSSP